MRTSSSKLVNQMAKKAGLSRRDFLRLAGVVLGGAAAGPVLAACSPATQATATAVIANTPGGAAAVANELNLWAWSIYAPAGAIESFQAETEATVHVTYYFGNSELLAKMTAGGAKADIIMPSQYRLNQFTAANLLGTIDESKLPNFGNLYDAVKNIPYMFHEEKRISVPYAFGVTGLVYNADEVSGPIDSWAAAWDAQYTGRIVMEDTESWIYASAMLLGHRLDQLTEDTDAKLAQIKAKMIEQKPLLLKLYHGLEEMRTLLASGDAIIAQTDDGLAWGMQKDGMTHIQTIVPTEGASGWQDQFCIPAGAEHPDLAHAWINHMLDAEVASSFTQDTGYLSVVEAAAPLLPAEVGAIVKHTDEELARVQFTPPYPDEIWAKLATTLEEAKAA